MNNLCSVNKTQYNMSDPIQLYSKLGEKTDYYLTITVNNKYYIKKRVIHF